MATWIVHLRLAENLLEMIEGLDAASFAIGNIAPDSGIPDENWENFTPPKEVSHFIVPTDDDPWRMVDLEFYRSYLAPMSWPGEDVEGFSLFLGYFLHLATDNLWNQQIARPTLTRFAAEFEADPKFIWEVKRDWYGLDFVYLYDHPESLFWRVFLKCEYEENCQLDFMPAEGLRRQIDYIKTYYQQQDSRQEAYERPDIYLSQAEMDRFVEETTRWLTRIYRYLWEEKGDTAGYLTTLELPLSLPTHQDHRPST
jgi:hypothetical protein